MASCEIGCYFHSFFKVTKMSHSLRDQHADSNMKSIDCHGCNRYLPGNVVCVRVNVQQRLLTANMQRLLTAQLSRIMSGVRSKKNNKKNCAATLVQWCHDNMTNSPIWVGG